MKEENTGNRRSPKNKFTENEMYTIRLPNGERDLRIENFLKDLENKFIIIRRNYLDKFTILSPEDHCNLIAFAIAQQCRTRGFRDHHRGQIQNELDLIKEIRERELGSKDISDPEKDLQKSQDQFLQEMFPHLFLWQLPVIIPHMHAKILCTDSQPGFITSDNPLVWFNPEAYKFPPLYRTPGLACLTLEITLPLSPRQLLFLHHRKSISEEIKPLEYINVPEKVVNELNRRARFHCNKEFIVNQNYTHPFWYESGESSVN